MALETFILEPQQLSQTERNEVRSRWQVAERERERAETERHTKARKIAAWILSHSKPVTAHTYLEDKGVKTFGDLHESRGSFGRGAFVSGGDSLFALALALMFNGN